MFQKHVSKHLSAFCHGELTAEETRRVGEHLRDCRRCQKEYEEIKLGVHLARHLSRISAPASLWNQIEDLLGEPRSSPSRLRLNSTRFAAAAAGLVLLVGLGVAWYFWTTRLEIDLDDYLTVVENSTAESSYEALAGAPSQFDSVDPSRALKAAKIDHVGTTPPLAGYALLASRLRVLGGQEAIQLVYGKGRDRFSVFVAPESVRFAFGRRDIIDTEIHGMSCRKVDCPRTSTFWFRAAGLHCVLVSKVTDIETMAQIINYFVSAHRAIGRSTVRAQ